MKENLLDPLHQYYVPVWLRVLAVVVFVGSIAVGGYFGASGYMQKATINNELYVRPPSWMFGAIWPVIYLVNCVALAYMAYKDLWPNIAYWAIIGIAVLGAIWSWLFVLGNTGALLLCMLVILCMLAALFTLWVALREGQNDFWYFFARNAVSLYLGWVTVATLLNLGMLMVHGLMLPQTIFTIIFWVAFVVLFALMTYIAYAREGRHGLKCLIGFWLGGLWGLAGGLAGTFGSRVVA